MKHQHGLHKCVRSHHAGSGINSLAEHVEEAEQDLQIFSTKVIRPVLESLTWYGITQVAHCDRLQALQ
jgi:hypothetical protein